MGVPGDAEPVLKRHRMRLAIEITRTGLRLILIELLRKVQSEFIGACVDIGNNLALLEDPLEVVTALAHLRSPLTSKTMRCRNMTRAFCYRRFH